MGVRGKFSLTLNVDGLLFSLGAEVEVSGLRGMTGFLRSLSSSEKELLLLSALLLELLLRDWEEAVPGRPVLAGLPPLVVLSFRLYTSSAMINLKRE